MKWYTSNTATQGLIIEEETGRTIAVSYDKADAELIAAAPELLEALNKIGVLLCDATVGDMVKTGVLNDGLCEEGETETGLALIVLGYLFNKVREIKGQAISKAEGE